MFRGFYTAASGMLTEMRREQIMTNNLANVNTPGYKSDQAVTRAFPQMLIERIRNGQVQDSKVGSLATGVYVQETIPKFTQGDLKETGQNTDVALLQGNVPNAGGSLFFAVKNANGQVRYTRDGNFTIDGDGRIVDNAGDFVLGTNGQPITVTDQQFQLKSDGTVVDHGRVAGHIQIAYAANPMNLVKQGNGLFKLQKGNALPSAVGNPNISYQLKQGFLERSNVNVDQSMVDLMEAFRNLQANQKVLKAYDHTMDLAVNKVGSVR